MANMGVVPFCIVFGVYENYSTDRGKEKAPVFWANEMEIKMKRTNQMSESLRLGMLLAVSGGFMDAYSYLLRDHVFANAQTGNILLFGVHLSEGNFGAAARYFLPVFAFAAGIALAELVRLKKSAAGHMAALLHWRQRAVLIEALILAGVAFFPLTMNPLANALTSFACGIQVESFRKIRGNGIATTMCIGNLRSGTQSLCQFLDGKDPERLRDAFLYYGIILCFVAGAVLGNFLIRILGEKAILCCSAFLLFVFLLMFFPEKEGKAKSA